MDEMKDSQRRRRDERCGTRSDHASSASAPYRSWKSPLAVRAYFESIAPRLDIFHHRDWCRISVSQICQHGGMWCLVWLTDSLVVRCFPSLRVSRLRCNGLIRKFNGTQASLQWKERSQCNGRSEWRLKNYCPARTFSKTTCTRNSLGVSVMGWFDGDSLADLLENKLDRLVELDLWIPKYRIGIEFQGILLCFSASHDEASIITTIWTLPSAPAPRQASTRAATGWNPRCAKRGVSLWSSFLIGIFLSLLFSLWGGMAEWRVYLRRSTILALTFFQLAKPIRFPLALRYTVNKCKDSICPIIESSICTL